MKKKNIMAALLFLLFMPMASAWFVPLSAAPPAIVMDAVQQMMNAEIASIQRAGIPLAAITAEQTGITLYPGQAFTAQLNATNTLTRAIPDTWTGSADTYMTYAYAVTTFYNPVGAVLNQSNPELVTLAMGSSIYRNISFTPIDTSTSGRYFATIALFEIPFNWNPNLGSWQQGNYSLVDSKSKAFVISVITAPAPQPSTVELATIINGILGSIYNFIRQLLGL